MAVFHKLAEQALPGAFLLLGSFEQGVWDRGTPDYHESWNACMGIVADLMCLTVREIALRRRDQDFEYPMIRDLEFSMKGLIKFRLGLMMEFFQMTSIELCDDEKQVWRCLLATVDEMALYRPLGPHDDFPLGDEMRAAPLSCQGFG